VKPQLVFLHGIGRPRNADQECKQWTKALAEGALRAGHSQVARSLEDGSLDRVSFAYYGDLFAPAQGQGAGGLELDDAEAQILVELMCALVDEISLAEAPGERERRALAQSRAQLTTVGQAQGSGNLMRRAINGATTLLSVVPLRRAGQWTAPKLMVGELAQVARYLARSEADLNGATLDQRIRARLLQVLGDGSSVVVTHSLGTVVALEALHQCPTPVPLFVTLGSPICMRTVVWPRLVPHPPCTPESVGRWLNFWDKDDVIAARPILEADMQPNVAGVRVASSRVDSDGFWVHAAIKYLASPAVAGPVAEALGSATP
jgi:pimeloyl-ACP methyl ester carboxylesterase